jgi:hypothetical protein
LHNLLREVHAVVYVQYGSASVLPVCNRGCPSKKYCAQLALALVLVLVLALLLLLLALALALALVAVVVVVVLLLLVLLRAAIPTRPSSCCAFAPSGLQTTNCIAVQITDHRRQKGSATAPGRAAHRCLTACSCRKCTRRSRALTLTPKHPLGPQALGAGATQNTTPTAESKRRRRWRGGEAVRPGALALHVEDRELALIACHWRVLAAPFCR